MTTESVKWMKRALQIASRGRTSPNPQVGAVLVKRNKRIGEGYHQKCGGPHAEVEALKDAGSKAKGADLYVTLEPCNHQGRTPPCTEAILKAGIKRVFIGSTDPDPDVRGGGAQRLIDEGLDVKVGVAKEQCERFYEAFSVHRLLKRPHVTVKAAMTLDGKIATRTGSSKWVTGPEARRAVHRFRDKVDAILVGVGTVLADDPDLTTRLERGKGHDPVRVIVDSHLKTPVKSRVISHTSDVETLVAHVGSPTGKKGLQMASGVELIKCKSDSGRVDLEDLLQRLAARGIVSLLVEGGGDIHGSFFERGLVDQVMIFVAPKVIGGRKSVPVVGGQGVKEMGQAIDINRLSVRRYGNDFLFSGKVLKPPV